MNIKKIFFVTVGDRSIITNLAPVSLSTPMRYMSIAPASTSMSTPLKKVTPMTTAAAVTAAAGMDAVTNIPPAAPRI